MVQKLNMVPKGGEVEAMVAAVDLNGDGVVSYEAGWGRAKHQGKQQQQQQQQQQAASSSSSKQQATAAAAASSEQQGTQRIVLERTSSVTSSLCHTCRLTPPVYLV